MPSQVKLKVTLQAVNKVLCGRRVWRTLEDGWVDWKIVGKKVRGRRRGGKWEGGSKTFSQNNKPFKSSVFLSFCVDVVVYLFNGISI